MTAEEIRQTFKQWAASTLTQQDMFDPKTKFQNAIELEKVGWLAEIAAQLAEINAKGR